MSVTKTDKLPELAIGQLRLVLGNDDITIDARDAGGTSCSLSIRHALAVRIAKSILASLAPHELRNDGFSFAQGKATA